MPTARRPVRVALGALIAALALTGCSNGGQPAAVRPTAPSTPAPTTPTAALPSVGSYVALGDSFTSGPGLAALRDGSGFCFRSDHNWPSLLATTLGTTSFDDVSCAGAETRDIQQDARGLTGAPPQIAAVTRDTDLVTVGIGGNDGGLFASLIAACSSGNGTCGTFARDTAPAILDQTVPSIVKALKGVTAAAPDATVVLVGYLRIMPESGTCEKIGIPTADAAALVTAEEALDQALELAARDAGVDFVSMRAVSRGHDACAGSQAWTNGADPGDRDGIAFHPRLAGMRAVARTVAAAL